MYDIDLNMWRLVNLHAKSTWTACDLAMAMPIDSKTILIFGGFDKTVRTQECFQFNVENNMMERESYLPKVGSFSNYVFSYDYKYFKGFIVLFILILISIIFSYIIKSGFAICKQKIPANFPTQMSCLGIFYDIRVSEHIVEHGAWSILFASVTLKK